jgi:hypothetical protein
MSALQKFITSARKLHAEEKDPATRWEKMTPLLQELLADPSVKEQSRRWPDCSQGGERAENLLFYEDPDTSLSSMVSSKRRTRARKSTITRTTGRSMACSMGPRRSSATSASMTGQNLITPKCANRPT